MSIILKKTYKIYLLTLLLVIFFCGLNVYSGRTKEASDNILWQKTYGGGDEDVIQDLIITNDDYLITVGSSSSWGDAWQSIWVMKLDSQGNNISNIFEGEKNYNLANSIVFTEDGNFIVAGERNWLHCSSCNEQGRAWIAKINPDLHIIWEKYLGDDKNNSIEHIFPVGHQGFVLSGLTQKSKNDKFNAWFAFLDWEGKYLWSKEFDNLFQDKATCILYLEEKGFLVAGHSQSSYMDKSDAWILKLTMDGNIEWEKHFIGSGINVINRIISSVDSGILAVGYTSSKGAGWQDAWVIQLDKDGNLEWEKTFGGDKKDIIVSAIKTDKNKYLLAGNTSSSGKGKISNAWVIQLDKDGNLEWEKTFGGDKQIITTGIISRDDKSIFLFGKIQVSDKEEYNGWIMNFRP
ncbi:MAG: hypothetical protein DRH33_08170 [Candidatus Nealsonbacteria bacterium]|nr:MAG: hypothetical protein DRH33_08170 [Candidatus Nealsonbacteria bacterium]